MTRLPEAQAVLAQAARHLLLTLLLMLEPAEAPVAAAGLAQAEGLEAEVEAAVEAAALQKVVLVQIQRPQEEESMTRLPRPSPAAWA